VFFHASQAPQFEDLAVGDRVAYDLGADSHGRPRAFSVRVGA
jgi:hypothetical protein